MRKNNYITFLKFFLSNWNHIIQKRIKKLNKINQLNHILSNEKKILKIYVENQSSSDIYTHRSKFSSRKSDIKMQPNLQSTQSNNYKQHQHRHLRMITRIIWKKSINLVGGVAVKRRHCSASVQCHLLRTRRTFTRSIKIVTLTVIWYSINTAIKLYTPPVE